MAQQDSVILEGSPGKRRVPPLGNQSKIWLVIENSITNRKFDYTLCPQVLDPIKFSIGYWIFNNQSNFRLVTRGVSPVILPVIPWFCDSFEIAVANGEIVSSRKSLCWARMSKHDSWTESHPDHDFGPWFGATTSKHDSWNRNAPRSRFRTPIWVGATMSKHDSLNRIIAGHHRSLPRLGSDHRKTPRVSSYLNFFH